MSLTTARDVLRAYRATHAHDGDVNNNNDDDKDSNEKAQGNDASSDVQNNNNNNTGTTPHRHDSGDAKANADNDDSNSSDRCAHDATAATASDFVVIHGVRRVDVGSVAAQPTTTAATTTHEAVHEQRLRQNDGDNACSCSPVDVSVSLSNVSSSVARAATAVAVRREQHSSSSGSDGSSSRSNDDADESERGDTWCSRRRRRAQSHGTTTSTVPVAVATETRRCDVCAEHTRLVTFDAAARHLCCAAAAAAAAQTQPSLQSHHGEHAHAKQQQPARVRPYSRLRARMSRWLQRLGGCTHRSVRRDVSVKYSYKDDDGGEDASSPPRARVVDKPARDGNGDAHGAAARLVIIGSSSSSNNNIVDVLKRTSLCHGNAVHERILHTIYHVLTSDALSSASTSPLAQHWHARRQCRCGSSSSTQSDSNKMDDDNNNDDDDNAQGQRPCPCCSYSLPHAQAAPGAVAWQRIGFQGSDPATDLRGTGVLGLLQLLYLLDYCPVLARDMYAACTQARNNNNNNNNNDDTIANDRGGSSSGSVEHELPFVLVSFNVTALVLDALQRGKADARALLRHDAHTRRTVHRDKGNGDTGMFATVASTAAAAEDDDDHHCRRNCHEVDVASLRLVRACCVYYVGCMQLFWQGWCRLAAQRARTHTHPTVRDFAAQKDALRQTIMHKAATARVFAAAASAT